MCPHKFKGCFYLYIYKFLTQILYFFVKFLLHRRLKAGKEDPLRYKEKMGWYATPRPEGSVIWIHAVSVGEFHSILSFLEAYKKLHPDYIFLITTTTTSSAKLCAKYESNSVIHQFLPIDCVPFVERFLKHWKPNMGIILETELWPNLILQASQHMHLVLLNATLSEASAKKWLKCKEALQFLLKRFTLILPSTPDDQARFQMFTKENIQFIGNLKFTSEILPIDKKKYAILARQILHSNMLNVFICASVHPKEIDACLSLASEDVLTIIIPRHPKTCGDIEAKAKKLGLITVIRSKKQKIGKCNVYIADTIGELGIFYHLNTEPDLKVVVFVGGSLIPHGGQNMLEPARFGCPTIVGPHVFNFTDIVQQMENHHCIKVVDSADQLKEFVTKVFMEEELRKQMKKNSATFIKKIKHILPEIIEVLEKNVPR